MMSAPQGSSGENSGDPRFYTEEQRLAVERILQCKPEKWYDILGVEETCSNDDVKTAYHATALAVHPDKNPHQGAKEAFQSEHEFPFQSESSNNKDT
jgi:DnaJ homolog subfamily B member 12